MSNSKPASDSFRLWCVVPLRIALVVFAAVVSAGILEAQSDTQPPRLLSLSISPASVDVTGSDQVVTFTVHMTDDLSGVSSASIVVVSPSGHGNVGNSLEIIPDGTLDAVVHLPVTIPRYSEPGTWSIDSLFLEDKLGNRVFMDKNTLNAGGFPTGVQVLDANPDLTPPQVQSFTFSPSSVDVSSAAQTINFDFQVTDDLSGISSLLYLCAKSPSGKQARCRGDFEIAGTNTNLSIRTSLTMPRYSEPGIWDVRVGLTDDVGNPTGFSTQLTVSSNPSDTTAPQLRGLRFTPSLINTSLSNQDVQVEFTITDDLSGVSFDTCNIFLVLIRLDLIATCLARGAVFLSPSGAQFAITNSISAAPPISGVPTNGTWRFPVTFPRFSEEGTWKVIVDLTDALGNQAHYDATQLAALGFPTDLIVIRPSLVPDGTISDPAAGGSISDNTFGDRAKVTVPPGVLSEPTTVAVDVLQSPLQVPLPVGFSGAETYFVNIEFLPTPTFPLPVPGLTLVLPLRNFTIPGTAINLFRIDPATGNLVPALNTSGNPVVGRVDTGGLTATFSGVTRLSTVVGLLATAVPVRVAVQQRTINTKSHGSIPVVIFSSPTLDATKIDPATLRFAGASVETKNKGAFQISSSDHNGDGLRDLLVHFETEELRLTRGDTQAVLEGKTFDNRLIRGVAPVKILK